MCYERGYLPWHISCIPPKRTMVHGVGLGCLSFIPSVFFGNQRIMKTVDRFLFVLLLLLIGFIDAWLAGGW